MMWPFSRKAKGRMLAKGIGPDTHPNLYNRGGMIDAIFATLGKIGDPPSTDLARIQTAELSPIVMACTRRIAWAAASAKFGVEQADGEIDFNHPMAQRIANPNSIGGHWGLITLVSASVALCARGYIYTPTSVFANEPPRALTFLRPDRIQRIADSNGELVGYRYNSGMGGAVELPIEHVCEIKHPWISDENVYTGWVHEQAFSQLTPAWSAISLFQGLSALKRKLLENSGGIPGIVVFNSKAESTLTEDQKKEYSDYLKLFRSDGEKFGQIALLDAGGGDAKFLRITEDLGAMEVHEGMEKAAREICAIMGVPPLILGMGGDATYANQQEARRYFWTDTVIPGYIEPIAAQLSAHLGVTIKPDYTDVPAMADYRMSLATSISQMDYLCINEKRALMGYPPILGGDELTVSPAFLPIAQVVDLAAQAEYLQTQDQARLYLRTGKLPTKPVEPEKPANENKPKADPKKQPIKKKAYPGLVPRYGRS